MPTYEYSCPKCGHHFELFQSMTDAPATKCPKCKKSGVKRLIGTGAGLVFKGSGFYETDFKHSSSKAPLKKSSGSETPAAPSACENCACKSKS